MSRLLVALVVFDLGAAGAGALKLRSHIGGSWLHAVAAALPIIGVMSFAFAAGMIGWAYRDDRGPFERPRDRS